MITGFSNFLRMIRKTVRGVDTSRQLACGMMFGMIIGLLPKDSLLPYMFLVVLILSAANLLSGAVAGAIFSCVGVAIDSVTNRIGAWVLTFDPLESTWSYLYQLPIVPWTRMENTVVMGALVLALVIAYPTYRISLYFFDHFGSEFGKRIMSSHFMQWLLGSPEHSLEEG